MMQTVTIKRCLFTLYGKETDVDREIHYNLKIKRNEFNLLYVHSLFTKKMRWSLKLLKSFCANHQ